MADRARAHGARPGPDNLDILLAGRLLSWPGVIHDEIRLAQEGAGEVRQKHTSELAVCSTHYTRTVEHLMVLVSQPGVIEPPHFLVTLDQDHHGHLLLFSCRVLMERSDELFPMGNNISHFTRLSSERSYRTPPRAGSDPRASFRADPTTCAKPYPDARAVAFPRQGACEEATPERQSRSSSRGYGEPVCAAVIDLLDRCAL